MLLVLMIASLAAPAQQSSAQVRSSSSTPPVVLRIASGPSGREQNGRYLLDEERTEFDPATDKQVVVVFQWQGEPGPHKLGVKWTGPDGSVVAPAPTTYVASDRQFGAFWSLTLSPQAARGRWDVEASVDGQPGGRYSFDVISANASTAARPAARRLLSDNELFAHASATYVLRDRTTLKGQRLDPAAAVVMGHGRLFTSVAAMDGADQVTAVLPDGSRQPIAGVLGINRQQDWIVLAGGPQSDISQPIAAESSVQVGDRLFTIIASAGSSRVLAPGTVIGRGGSPASGPRLIVNAGMEAPGGGVFNEFGELVGVVGGSLISGSSDLSQLMHFRAELHGAPVVPISLIRSTLDGPTMSVAEFRRTQGCTESNF